MQQLFVLLTLLAPACATPMRYGAGGGKQFKTTTLAYGGASAVLVQAKGAGNARTFCLLPPAQAAATFTVKGNIKSTAKSVPVEIGAEGSSAITQLFSQSAASLHLQMASWRVCEAYLNGVIDKAQYHAQLKDVIAAAAELARAEPKRQDAAIEAAKARAAEADADGKARVEAAKAETEAAKADAEAAREETKRAKIRALEALGGLTTKRPAGDLEALLKGLDAL